MSLRASLPGFSEAYRLGRNIAADGTAHPQTLLEGRHSVVVPSKCSCAASASDLVACTVLSKCSGGA